LKGLKTFLAPPVTSSKTKLVYVGLIFKPNFELVLEGFAHACAGRCEVHQERCASIFINLSPFSHKFCDKRVGIRYEDIVPI
jgi:hypothetical protein